jgi:preprotein translocase subunit SecG
MLWYHYVFGAVLILASIIITIVVLMQEGRSQNLSGAIAGGAETFLGKSKGRTIEAKLEKITKWLIVAFFACCISHLPVCRISKRKDNLAACKVIFFAVTPMNERERT